ncbi:phospholipase A2 inhibitor and Ly6/PLAUR domain-containing protein-like isoform X2 [Ascaphus truei]|uniref:phospholipase A2 inhibitor and Ly6/PLAUR domain-containing protein-like isoform X2 n=1 Tax=Ascaphus truei TaxID=8439 RepID=UPI003F5ABB4E
MRPLLIFTVISALAAPGYSLLCSHCNALGETSCTGDEKKCPSDDYMCGSTNTVTIMEGVASKMFTRSCEKRSACGISASIGFLKGKIKTATSCCNMDSCTPSMPILPIENFQKNGVTCQSCTSSDSYWCHTGETMECTGEEKRCIRQSTKTSGAKSSTIAVRGCATKNICDLGNQDHDYGRIKTITEMTCTSSSINVHHNLLLLALAALLSMKLML